MATCSTCKSSFDAYAPLKLEVRKSGTRFLVYAKNQSRSIIVIERMLVCRVYTWGTSIGYYRDGDFYGGGSGRLEQGITSLKHLETSTATAVQAWAEYREVTGRSESACFSL